MAVQENHAGSSKSDLPVLLERICGSSKGRKIIFLVGSPMSRKPGDKEKQEDAEGVPDVAAMTADIFKRLGDRAGDLTCTAQDHAYQKAFAELQRIRPPEEIRELLRDTVLQAYDPQRLAAPKCWDDRRFEEIEADELGWNIPRGTRALGRIIAEFPGRFRDVILTTNFDPLITLALRLAHCPATQTILQGDGNPAQTLVKGCHVIHLHGYWYGSDTLHTSTQLVQERPILKAYLKDLMRKYTIVVVGYSGWDDLFTSAVSETSIEQNAQPDILWTFYGQSDEDKERVRGLMPEAYALGRAQFYFGIDCHDLFPRLLRELRDASITAAEMQHVARKPLVRSSKLAGQRYSGIIQDIRWTWDRDADAVLFDRPRRVEWFKTTRSIVIEEVATRADWDSGQNTLPKHLWVCGSATGGRHLVFLSEHEVEACERRGDSWVGTRIEIPWQADREDSLFSCTLQYAETHRLRGFAASLTPPEPPGSPDLTPPESATSSANFHMKPVQALQGVWLKLSAAGGVFVVKLHADFSLTEYLITEPRETWAGKWALGGQLMIKFEGWELETRKVREKTAANVRLEDWGMFAATERQLSSLDRIPFLVVHVLLPPEEKTAYQHPTANVVSQRESTPRQAQPFSL